MKVTMLRAGDKIMQELVFINSYSAVGNFRPKSKLWLGGQSVLSVVW